MTDYANGDGYIWFNGEFVPWADAKTHVLNHGLHYASCVFEGIRIYHRKPFKSEEHIQRFARSAKLLGFELPYGVADLVEVCEQATAKQNVEEGYIRPLAWRGSEQIAISAQKTTINVAVAVWSWPSYFAPEAKEKGIRLALSKWLRPSPQTAPVAAKAAGLYMICTLSKHDAEAKGFDDALMLDYKQRLAEATGANLFWVKDGELFTPPSECVLNGITRLTVMDLARGLGITVIERHGTLEDLSRADEVFLTGTAVEITPVAAVDDHSFEVGEVSKRLIAAYAELIKA